VTYTYAFEEHVLFLLIGSNEEEVSRRLGISAEMIGQIVERRLTHQKVVDPDRVIDSIGLDEISLKKRHKLYVTILTDLSDPQSPKVLAVMKGRDEAAAAACLALLSDAQREAIKTHRTDMCAAYPAACAKQLSNSRNVIDRFHVAKKFGEAIDSLRKQLTRAYKADLTKEEQKQFRTLMWEFRCAPERLSEERMAALEGLFRKIPKLEELYRIRLRFKEIFDNAPDRTTAARWLRDLKRRAAAAGLDLGAFWNTYENWKSDISNYFDERQTSGVVEGINNKARVITKRAYGIKSANSLWTRLILDLNCARQAVARTIQQVRETLRGLKTLFMGPCT